MRPPGRPAARRPARAGPRRGRALRLAARAGALGAGLLGGVGGSLAAQGVPRAAPFPPASVRDTVRVRVDAAGAWVEQRIPHAEGIVEAYAIRLGGRRPEVASVEREGERLLDAVLEPRAGAYRFHVRSGAPVRVRYRVPGPAERIPLFAPAGPGEVTVARDPGAGVVVIVHLPAELAARVDPGTSLPRLRRAAEARDGARETAGPGATVARGRAEPAGEVVLVGEAPATPSFVHLRRSGVAARGADALAVLVILLGAAWAWRRGRRETGAEPARTPARTGRSRSAGRGPRGGRG